jgi:ACS family tartrate transporter-like MFS transporter
VKRLTGLPIHEVTLLVMVPTLLGILGILLNGWHADKTSERRLHTAIPLLVAGALYALAMLMRHNVYAAIPLVLLGFAFYFPYYPTFWSIPTLILTESAAAATFGLINSVGQLGGLAGPYIIGRLNRSHPLAHCQHRIHSPVMPRIRIHNPQSAHSRSGFSDKEAKRSEKLGLV